MEEDDDVVVTTLDLFKADLPSVAGRNIESGQSAATAASRRVVAVA
jgi:hypothetical protein